jgi:hypothetical protein
MDKTKQILEALKMQPLSEEEKAARHILGRLYGPIATCKEGTRNGRLYNKDLWEKALTDDIFKEKLANKSLFLELGHPADREETDMEKVCACIPEMPKIVDGDLYAYVDILDTNNGRLLKTLCDYGFVPGISSRGSGDVMDNDEVDPETFFLETWDIVQLPAVKKARLKVCESLDTEDLKLKQALTESYNSSNEKDKEIMKEALNNLDIKLDEAADKPLTLTEATQDELATITSLLGKKLNKDAAKVTIADLNDFQKQHSLDSKDVKGLIAALQEDVKPTADKAACDKTMTECENKPDATAKPAAAQAAAPAAAPITEAAKDAKAGAKLPGGTPKDVSMIPESQLGDELTEAKGEDEDDEKEDDSDEAKEGDKPEEAEKEEHKEDEKHEEEEKPAATDTEAAPLEKVDDLVKALSDYKDRALEIGHVIVDGKEYAAELKLDGDEDGKLIIGISCAPTEGSENTTAEADKADAVADSTGKTAESKEAESAEEAADGGDDVAIESLKEAIRQKDALDKEVKALKNKQTVGDAEVKGLKESLDKYKTAFARVSELAAKAAQSDKDAKSLSEQLKQRDATITQLKEQAAAATSLTESAHTNETKVKSLTEQLASMQADSETKTKTLQEQLEQAKQRVIERTTLAKRYKAKADAMLEKYIASKASMLGVRSAEITSRLNENYTMDDIDSVCDDLLDKAVNINRLPFGIDRSQTKVAIKEAVEPKAATKDPDDGYEPDDSLFELAGIDKNNI